MANKYNPKRPAENGLGGLTAPTGITEEGAERIQNLAGAFNLPTNWDARAQELADKLQNRDPFAYNPNEDPLWQGMKGQYIEGGQRAMQDTMGQAAALTGGFANSYAQSAGQQSYNDFMTKLTAQLPAAYDRARATYDAEGDALLQQLSVAQGMANTAYQRQRDALADQRYDQEWQYQLDRDALADQRYDTEWNWQMEQTALERERQSRLDAADQAYRDWQMGRAEAGDARDIALMMIQTGKMPSEDLLRAAGISSKDAKTMSDFYAGQYAAQAAAAVGRSSGGGGGYRSTGSSTQPSTTPTSQPQKYTTQEVNDAYKAAKQAILMSGQTGNINYAVDALDKYADYLTPEMAAELMDMLDRIRKNIANPDPYGERNKKNNSNSGGSGSKPGTGGGSGGKWVDMIM